MQIISTKTTLAQVSKCMRKRHFPPPKKKSLKCHTISIAQRANASITFPCGVIVNIQNLKLQRPQLTGHISDSARSKGFMLKQLEIKPWKNFITHQ